VEDDVGITEDGILAFLRLLQQHRNEHELGGYIKHFEANFEFKVLFPSPFLALLVV
jgi:hypothetical protein